MWMSVQVKLIFAVCVFGTFQQNRSDSDLSRCLRHDRFTPASGHDEVASRCRMPGADSCTAANYVRG